MFGRLFIPTRFNNIHSGIDALIIVNVKAAGTNGRDKMYIKPVLITINGGRKKREETFWNDYSSLIAALRGGRDYNKEILF